MDSKYKSSYVKHFTLEFSCEPRLDALEGNEYFTYNLSNLYRLAPRLWTIFIGNFQVNILLLGHNIAKEIKAKKKKLFTWPREDQSKYKPVPASLVAAAEWRPWTLSMLMPCPGLFRRPSKPDEKDKRYFDWLWNDFLKSKYYAIFFSKNVIRVQNLTYFEHFERFEFWILNSEVLYPGNEYIA